MFEAGINPTQAEALLDNSKHRRFQVKFICERIKNLTSREIATILGMEKANSIYKYIDKLNKDFEGEGFQYELKTSSQGAAKKASIKRRD